MSTPLFARLEYDPCNPSQGTRVVIYRNKADAKLAARNAVMHIISFPLTNEDLTELLVIQKLKPENMDK